MNAEFKKKAAMNIGETCTDENGVKWEKIFQAVSSATYDPDTGQVTKSSHIEPAPLKEQTNAPKYYVPSRGNSRL